MTEEENKHCPLNRDYYCDDRCKWFDIVSEVCQITNTLQAINKTLCIEIDNLNTTIFDGLNALFQKS